MHGLDRCWQNKYFPLMAPASRDVSRARMEERILSGLLRLPEFTPLHHAPSQQTFAILALPFLHAIESNRYGASVNLGEWGLLDAEAYSFAGSVPVNKVTANSAFTNHSAHQICAKQSAPRTSLSEY